MEIVEFQVTQALEWLGGRRNEKRRLAAVLVLKVYSNFKISNLVFLRLGPFGNSQELALNTPTLFNVYVNSFLDHIWVTSSFCFYDAAVVVVATIIFFVFRYFHPHELDQVALRDPKTQIREAAIEVCNLPLVPGAKMRKNFLKPFFRRLYANVWLM